MAGMIRSTHPCAFRAGQWAVLEAAICEPHRDRPCYMVRFEDGTVDLWVIGDILAGYEFA